MPARSAALVRSTPPPRLKALVSFSNGIDNITSNIQYMLVYLTVKHAITF
jgi:hypothetical protein